jgi:hypothetical protein
LIAALTFCVVAGLSCQPAKWQPAKCHTQTSA